MNAPGKKFLKATGVLYIVFSGIEIFISLMGMDDALVGFALEFATGLPLPVILLNSISMLFIGIVGVKYCNVPKKAKLLMGIAIVSLILDGIIIVIMSQWSMLIAVPLPIFYLIGAIKNKNAA